MKRWLNDHTFGGRRYLVGLRGVLKFADEIPSKGSVICIMSGRRRRSNDFVYCPSTCVRDYAPVVKNTAISVAGPARGECLRRCRY